MTDDHDEYEHDSADNDAAYEAEVQLAWRDALDWAKRGNYQYLADLLRGELPLQDDRSVRSFLADALDGTIKRPRGKPPVRPNGTFVTGPKDEVLWIDERDKDLFAIRKWISDKRPQYGDAVTAEAARHFKMDEEALINLVRRSAAGRKTARSS